MALIVCLLQQSSQKAILQWRLQENLTRSPCYIAPLFISLTGGPCYNNMFTLCPITHLHVFSLRPPCFLYVPWRHTLNLHCTCVHHVYTMRNPCPLMSSPNPNSISRLFPILLDPKSFQTALDYSSLYHMTSRSRALHLL